MNTQLSPVVIEKAYGKYLTLADAQCLFHLFTDQANGSQWIDSNTVACWLFKTNKPTSYQLKRAKSLLHKLSASDNWGRRKTCLLEMKMQAEDSGYGSMIIKPVYKLSSSAFAFNSVTACPS